MRQYLNKAQGQKLIPRECSLSGIPRATVVGHVQRVWCGLYRAQQTEKPSETRRQKCG